MFLRPLWGIFLVPFVAMLWDGAASQVSSPGRLVFALGRSRNVSLLQNATVEAVIPRIPADVTYITFQLHTQHQNATVSYHRVLTSSSSLNGSDAGLLFPLMRLQRTLTWYLRSPERSAITGTGVILPYGEIHPVPGGCNTEYNLLVDPNIYLQYNLFETIIQFAPANIGYARGRTPPPCDVNSGQSSRWRLEYDVYQYFLPENDLSGQVLIEHIQKVASVQQMVLNGKKLVMLKSVDKTMVSFSSVPGQGVIYSVIVRDPLLNSSASYVPVHTYACNFSSNLDNCYTLVRLGLTALGGAAGGVLLVLCWWRFGSVLLCVVIVGLILGFLVSSLLFFTPIGDLSIFRTDSVFWPTFCSVVVVIPLIFFRWPREGNITACGVAGGYAVILAVNSYIYTSLSYITLDVLKRALNNQFSRAFTNVPFQGIDYILTTVWAVLAVSGVVLQLYRERSRPFFPPSPYLMWKQERERRKTNILDPSYHIPSLRSRLKSRVQDMFRRREPAGERTPLLL
ncbi:transmembrane 7 superfamily member 3 isoform X3 [Lepisosteus oculatus]|uniref:transmembrane 7 superfamily member 3 isoform X3 n=1 Tax=Lepisosteus oculatus TaxID=7918 RepID=UPI003710696E